MQTHLFYLTLPISFIRPLLLLNLWTHLITVTVQKSITESKKNFFSNFRSQELVFWTAFTHSSEDLFKKWTTLIPKMLCGNRLLLRKNSDK